MRQSILLLNIFYFTKFTIIFREGYKKLWGFIRINRLGITIIYVFLEKQYNIPKIIEYLRGIIRYSWEDFAHSWDLISFVLLKYILEAPQYHLSSFQKCLASKNNG